MKIRGKHIIFEGPDGVGKSTLSKKIARELVIKEIPLIWTYEPTKNEIGSYVRQLLANGVAPDMDLFTLDREIHYSQLSPLLEAGVWVIQDRYFYSTAAYQSQKLEDIPIILNKNRQIVPEPDLCFLLMSDDPKYLDYNIAEKTTQDVFENEEHRGKVRNYYKYMLDNELFECKLEVIHTNQYDINTCTDMILSSIFTQYPLL